MAELLFYHRFSNLFIVEAENDDRKLPIELWKMLHQCSPAFLCVAETVHRRRAFEGELRSVIKMQIESPQQISSSKLDSEVSLFVYLISNIEIALLNTIEFHYFIQFINYNMPWLEVPWLQVLNQLDYKALVNRIMKVIKWIFSKFIKGLTFDMSRHVVSCL
jgi:hypothetical protein